MTDSLTRTPRFALPFLFPGQAQRELFVNEALIRIDAGLHAAVLDSRADPPSDLAEGDCYLITESASGEWTGKEGRIATYSAGTWHYQDPLAGMRVWEAGRAAWAHFDGNSWVRVTRPYDPSGGPVVDEDACAAVANLVTKLVEAGIFSAS